MLFENPSPMFSALRRRETDFGYPHRRCLGNGTDDVYRAQGLIAAFFTTLLIGTLLIGKPGNGLAMN